MIFDNEPITFFVGGRPVQQGSMKHVGNGRIIHMKSKELNAWRERIAWSAKAAGAKVSDAPFRLELIFYFKRPKSSKRMLPTVPPDLDKEIRSCFDALNGIAWIDDAQVVEVLATKLYEEIEGVDVKVIDLSVTHGKVRSSPYSPLSVTQTPPA